MTRSPHKGHRDRFEISSLRVSLWRSSCLCGEISSFSALPDRDAEPLVPQVAGGALGLVPVVVGAADFPPVAALDEHLEPVVERDGRGGGGLGAGGGGGQTGQGPGGDDGGQDQLADHGSLLLGAGFYPALPQAEPAAAGCGRRPAPGCRGCPGIAATVGSCPRSLAALPARSPPPRRR